MSLSTQVDKGVAVTACWELASHPRKGVGITPCYFMQQKTGFNSGHVDHIDKKCDLLLLLLFIIVIIKIGMAQGLHYIYVFHRVTCKGVVSHPEFCCVLIPLVASCMETGFISALAMCTT